MFSASFCLFSFGLDEIVKKKSKWVFSSKWVLLNLPIGCKEFHPSKSCCSPRKTGLKISPVETFDNLKFSLIGVGVLSIASTISLTKWITTRDKKILRTHFQYFKKRKERKKDYVILHIKNYFLCPKVHQSINQILS